ncbi:hypothetical protein OC846_005342 [Tilletia horrida]|uniref:RING-type domain-containing protein n=1 Tax=Tilletia horrida TaxID=155126 RepID=A0AAN6JQ03_9BASI|nr:hypothetical protein OC846_005342 [Tilletia horrida]
MSSRSSSPGYQELGTTLPNRARQEDTDREIIEIIDSSDEEDNPASRPNLSVSNTTCLPCPSSNSAAPPSMTDYSSPTETPVLRRSTRNKPTKSYKSNRGKRAKASISRQDSSSTSSAQKRRSLSPTPLNPSAPKKANLSKDAEDERTPTKGNARALDPKTPSCSSSFMFVDVPNRTHAQASSSSTVLEKDTGSLRAKFALLEAKHADLEAKYACIAAEHTVLETEHAMLKTEHALLETRASVLESENMALSADRDGLQHYAKKTEEYLTCGVCMDIHLRPFTLDPCGHNCCLRCLHSWLATNRTCPLCAVNIKKAFPNTDMGSLAQLLVEQFPAKGHDEDDLGEAETLFLLTREGSSDRNFVRVRTSPAQAVSYYLDMPEDTKTMRVPATKGTPCDSGPTVRNFRGPVDPR